MDLGGSVVSGIDGNPLALMATQLGIPLHSIDNDTPLHFPDGSPVSKSVDREVIWRTSLSIDICLFRASSCTTDCWIVARHVERNWEGRLITSPSAKHWRLHGGIQKRSRRTNRGC